MAGLRRPQRDLAVSSSRISPTQITSGSCRSILRNALANVMSALALISNWLMPGKWASIGSSTVMTFRVVRSIWLSMEYNVVVFPLPVGPHINTMPAGCVMASPIASRLA